ncbi:MAG: hypothetical protein EZS28_013157 [Streblomastix strix]|uniref:RING-type domain-containing protein n=1 Tax=Streblomastix strix TaxID=222440 RepID=A0A5J4W8T1_9EUKA|nr:MAG: hypothetical protein EZS28_013157 [Streblomastix strix]
MSEEDDDEYEYEEEDEDPQSQGAGRSGQMIQFGESRPVVEFEFIHKDELEAKMNRLVDEFKDICSLAPDQIILLLIYFQWNRDKLEEKFFDKRDDILIKAGIEPSSKVTRKEKENKRTGLRSDQSSKCRICDDDMIPGKSSSLSCGHSFCNDCLRMRLESQLKMGPSCITATCPEQDCNVIFPYSVAKRILHRMIN